MITSSAHGSVVRSGTLQGSARRRTSRGDVANRRAPSSPTLAIRLRASPPTPTPAAPSPSTPPRRTRPVAARAAASSSSSSSTTSSSSSTTPSSPSSSSADGSPSFRSPGAPVAAPTTPLLLQLLIEALFRFPPIFDSAVRAARAKISQRGLSVGVDIEGYAAELERAKDWEEAMREIEDAGLAYPEYYLEPFHCYETGNLNWEAALEGPASSKAVHAPVMDTGSDPKEPAVLDPKGDETLRRSHSSVAARLITEAFQEMGSSASASSSSSSSGPSPSSRPFDFGAARLVVDLGCSVGLSTRELGRAFPRAELVGVDLSPQMLSVFAHLQSLSAAEANAHAIPEAAGSLGPKAGRKARLIHAAAEKTGLESGVADVASLHLVMHELPQSATRAVLREAFRILKPGGVVILGEMDPGSAAFGRVLGSPLAFAAFRSSEPHLLEYITLDVPAAAREAGFVGVRTAAHSPRHFTLVGVKPPAAEAAAGVEREERASGREK